MTADTQPLAPARDPRNFQSHALVEARAGVFGLRPALRVRVFAWVCMLPGWLVLLVALLGAFEHPAGAALLAFFGGSFVAGGLWLLGPAFRFDLQRRRLRWGYFWNRRSRDLAEVAALQIVDGGWHVVAEADDFRTLQLNVVFRNGNPARLNVLNHSQEQALRETGARLAELLHVPLRISCGRGLPRARR